MMLLGVTNAWGQTDYSGTYYIAAVTYNATPSNNFYLCPTENWKYYDSENNTYTSTSNGKPFLTTYKCRGTVDYVASKALWVVEKHPTLDYYYIKHAEDNKYITYNNAYFDNIGRVRVHLDDSPVDDDDALFAINYVSSKSCYEIISKKASETESNGGRIYLNVNKGNKESLEGKDDKMNDVETGGIIGLWTSGSEESTGSGKFYFEEYIKRPTIVYNSDNLIEITANSGETTPVIKYTTDGSQPSSTNGETYSGPFDPEDGVTTIKAVEIVNGELSNVATFTPTVLLGSNHKYLIQSKECQFYNLIPNVSVDNDTKYVSTLNVPCVTMAWHFENASDGYYYIVDKNGWYMYFTTTDNSSNYIYLKSSKDNSDGYKFSITAHASGGYNLIPKGQNKSVSKYIKGNSDIGLKPAKIDAIASATSRWDLIPYSTSNLPQWADAPFTYVSDDNNTYYYQIVSVSQSTKSIILNNDGDIKSQVIPNGIDERKTMWIIKQVVDDGDELLDFYTFQNAYTGQKLYYNGKGRLNISETVIQLGLPSVLGADETWSHFVIVQTETGYNIIPRAIIDDTKAIDRTSEPHSAFNCINRASGGDNILGTFYDDGGGSRWTFTQVSNPVQCMDPVITLDNDNARFSMSCVTNAAKIYYTLDGETPTIPASGTTLEYTDGSFVPLTSAVVKIIAVAATAVDGSDISSEVSKDKVDEPTITINTDNSVTIASATDGATIYYKLGGDSPTTSNGIQSSSIASILPSLGPIKAFAVKDGLINSNIATESDIPAKTIAVSSTNALLTSEDPIVYDGSAQQPAFTLKDGETTIASSEYTAAYSDNISAGTATITISDKTDGDYNVSGSFTFTITQKGLTITAKANEITYGDSPTNDGVTYSGFVEGEDEDTDGMFTGTLTYTYDYNQFDDINGAYTITPDGLSATNYAITFTPGTLTVNPKEVNLVWSETPLTYNGNPQTPTATVTGTVNNDEVNVTVTGEQTNAGTGYTATASGLTGVKAGNYKLPSEVTTTFGIEKANIKATVSILDWTYGEDAETPSVMGNIEDGVVTYSYKVKDAEDETYTVTVPTNAGTYTVKAGIGATDNYQAGDVTADFTISPKSIGDGNLFADGITLELTPTGELTAVKDGSTTLAENTDFTCEVTMDGADRMVTITGIGNYTGSANGIYANPTFKDPDGSGSEKAAAVYQAKRDMAYPSGIKPYIVKKVNPTIGTMNIVPLDYIPEGVPVLLLSDAEAEGFVASPKEESTPEITDAIRNSNQLKMAPEGGVAVKDREAYMFYLGEFVLAFEGTIKKGNFYLMNPNYSDSPGINNAASRRTLQFVIEDVETGIDNSQSSMLKVHLSNEWFALDGRRLNGKPTQKGLYIVNGQKVVIK